MLLKMTTALLLFAYNYTLTSSPYGASAVVIIFSVKDRPRCHRTMTALICS